MTLSQNRRRNRRPKLRMYHDGETLDVTGNRDLITLDSFDGVLEWENNGEVRRVPSAVLGDVARQLWNHERVPERYQNVLPAVVISWESVNPRAYEHPPESKSPSSLPRWLRDLLQSTGFD